MQLTDAQEAAVSLFVDWLDNYSFDKNRPDLQIKRLFGYAGAGKTTIMREIDRRTKRKCLFAAYSGKAAMVLRSKGCSNAQTIHKMIYEPRGTAIKHYQEELARLETMTDVGERAKQEALLADMREAMNSPAFVKKLPIEFDKNSAFIIDEASMPDKWIGEDLLYYGFPVLAVGDPAQLPPVKGLGFFTHGHKPDVLLTEIHRQAAESPVLKLATAIRGGKLDFGYGKLGTSRIVPSLTVPEYTEYDQVLCGTNKTRIAANTAMRKHMGRVRVLEEGEKLICLQNNYETGVMNGSQWEVLRAEGWRSDKGFQFYRADLKSLDEEGVFHKGALIHLNPLLEGRPQQDQHWTPMLTGEPRGLVMTYGYCVTVHKAQGSQWNSVALIDDWSNQASKKEWLYTGVTRAAERVTIIKKG